MAEFNPDIPSVNGPDYFSLSKGVSVPENTNTKAKTVVGLANIGTGAAEAADTGIQLQIKKDVYDFSDKLRDQWGNSAAVQREQQMPFDIRSNVQAASTPATGVPPDVQGLGPKLDRLKQAKAAGKLENSDYWAQAESLVRQINARYPGYRDVIDRDVSQTLGNIPANALHEALMTELKATQTSAQKARDEYVKFIDTNQEWLPSDTRARLDAGNPYPMSYLYSVSSSRQAAVKDLDARKSLLAYKKMMKEDASEEAERTYAQDAHKTVQDTLKSIGPAAGFSSYQNMVEFVNNRGKQGGGFNETETGALQNYFTLAETELRQALAAKRSSNLSKEPGQFTSYDTMVDPARLSARDEQALTAFLAYKNAVLRKDFSMATYWQNIANTSETKAVATALQDPTILEAHTVYKTLGNEGMPLWLRQQGKTPGSTNLGDINTSLHQLNLTKSAFGGFKSVGDVIYTTRQQQTDNGGDGKDPAPYNAAIDDRVNTILDKNTDQRYRAAYIREMFGPDNAGFLQKFADTPQAPRSQLFTKLTSQQMTDAVFSVAKEDPQVWQHYVNWSAQSFAAQFHSDGTTLQNAVAGDRNSAISWDQGAKQFVYQSLVPGYVNTPAKQAVDRLNSQIRTMDNILTKDGRDSGAEFQKLFTAMGIDMSASAGKGSPNRTAQGAMGTPGLTAPGSSTPLGQTGETGGRTLEGSISLPNIPGADTARRALEAYTARNRARYGQEALPFNSTQPRPLSGALGAIQSAIHGAESASSGGYNAIAGEKQGVPNLSEMTVNDVLSLQKGRIKEGLNSAAGAYQITYATLKGLVSELGLSGDEPFNKETQDRLFETLLNRRGAQEFVNGRMSESAFAQNLSREWAGLPGPNGKSFYEGVGNNKANVSYATVLDAIRSFKQQATATDAGG